MEPKELESELKNQGYTYQEREFPNNEKEVFIDFNNFPNSFEMLAKEKAIEKQEQGEKEEKQEPDKEEMKRRENTKLYCSTIFDEKMIGPVSFRSMINNFAESHPDVYDNLLAMGSEINKLKLRKDGQRRIKDSYDQTAPDYPERVKDMTERIFAIDCQINELCYKKYFNDLKNAYDELLKAGASHKDLRGY